MLLGRVNISLASPSASATMAHLVAGAYGEAKRPELETRQRNQRPMIVYLNTIGLFRTVSRLHCASEVVIQEEHQVFQDV